MKSAKKRFRSRLWRIGPALMAGAFLMATGAVGQAENWPNLRGPHFNGSSEAGDLPAQWSMTENMAWIADMPGSGSGTPVVWGDRVFVSSTVEGSEDLVGLCVDARTGEILWSKVLSERTQRFARNDQAPCSAATDGRHVYFMFSTGALVALDFDGAEVWRRDLEEDYGILNLQFGYGGSPILFDGKMYLSVIRGVRSYRRGVEIDPEDMYSFLLCINPENGQTIWLHKRPTDAVGESYESYSSPIPCQTDDGWLIVLTGGDYVTAHQPASGEEVWRLAYNPARRDLQRLIASATGGPGLVYASVLRGQTLLAIDLKSEGAITMDDAVWQSSDRQMTPDVSTPLLYNGELYVLNGDRRSLHRLDPRTGETIWDGDLGGSAILRASPTGADGKIYMLNMAGEAIVAATGPEFKILHRIEMGGQDVQASISVTQGRLFIRTSEKLFCVANTPAAE